MVSMVSTKTGFGSDMDIIFQSRIGSDSKNPLSDHLCNSVMYEYGLLALAAVKVNLNVQ